MPAVTVVFDLDGTLVDTAPDLVDTLNVVFTQEGLPTVPFDKARNLIGGGARRMIERGLQAEGRSCATAEIDRWTTNGELVNEIEPIFALENPDQTGCPDCDLFVPPKDQDAPVVSLDSQLLRSASAIHASMGPRFANRGIVSCRLVLHLQGA